LEDFFLNEQIIMKIHSCKRFWLLNNYFVMDKDSKELPINWSTKTEVLVEHQMIFHTNECVENGFSYCLCLQYTAIYIAEFVWLLQEL
jgi:hypothetical protein